MSNQQKLNSFIESKSKKKKKLEHKKGIKLNNIQRIKTKELIVYKLLHDYENEYSKEDAKWFKPIV